MGAMASQITGVTIVYSDPSKKTPKLRVTGLCEGNTPVTSEFPAQRTSNAKIVSIWCRHHDLLIDFRVRIYDPLVRTIYYDNNTQV